MSKQVTIHAEQVIFQKFVFKIIEATLQHTRTDGEMSEVMTRLKFERGDSVAALMHHPENDTIILTEQFRYPAHAKDRRGKGWLLELPAGIIDSGETPSRAIKREIVEETGYEAATVHPVYKFFVSPGGTSERIHLYYARLDTEHPVHEGGGLVNENEDIRVLNLSVDEALEKMQAGEIVDAKTLIALQWLQMNRDSLATLGSENAASTSESTSE